MRSMWKGAMGVGLISVPIKLYKATDEGKVDLHMACDGCGGRITYRYACVSCGAINDSRPKAKRFDLDEQFAIITEADLQTLPLKSVRAVDLIGFTEDRMDIRAQDGIFYAAPDKGGEKPFGLLLAVMIKLAVQAVAKITMRDKEFLCAIAPYGGIMLVQKLLYADQIRDYAELVPAPVQLSDRELALGESLVNQLRIDFRHETYVDQYRPALQALVEAKLEGREIAAPAEPKALTGGQDLASLLEATLSTIPEKEPVAAGKKKKKGD